MKLTTLCYIEKDNKVLLLYRNKKENDLNEGKWIGVGGKLEQNESPDECIIREVYEETGLHIQPQLRGILTFILPKWENELTFLYTSNHFEGTIKECNEGQLHWIDKDKVIDLNLWEGDKHFLPKLLETNDFFTMKVVYDKEDQLLEVK